MCRVKHSYGQTMVLSSDASVSFKTGTAQGVFLNDLFAPAGPNPHQPYGRDQMAILYARYKVLNCRVRLEATVNSGTGTGWLVCGIKNPTSGLSIGGILMDYLSEDPLCLVKTIPQGRPTIIDQRIKCSQASDVTDEVYMADDSLYGAAVGSSPTRTPSLLMCFASNATSFACVLRMVVEYDALWYDRIIQNNS